MSNPSAPSLRTVLPVSVFLGPPLLLLAEGHHPLHDTVCGEIHRTFVDLLASLGVPGEPVVALSAIEDPARTHGVLQLFVNGRECRYSDDLVQLATSYAAAVPLSALGGDKLPDWLRARVKEPVAASPLPELIASLCSEIVERAPSLLLGPDQLAAYCATLPAPREESPFAQVPWPPAAEAVGHVLRIILDQKLSIADTQVVADFVARGLGTGRRQDDIAEELIVALRPRALTLQINADYLRDLTLNEAADASKQIGEMRDRLFRELGMEYPEIELEPRTDLKPTSFALRVNHLVTLPRIGLEPGRRLVDHGFDRLSLLGIEGIAAKHPATGADATLVDELTSARAEAAGVTTWDAFGYLILCLEEELRQHSAHLLDRERARTSLERFAERFPALVAAARRKVSGEKITRTLRGLLAERVSVRNMRGILEAIVDFDYIVADPATLIVFDDRLPMATEPDAEKLEDPSTLVAFVRMCLRRTISHLYTSGRNSLRVYLVDAALEHELAKGGVEVGREREILAAVREEVTREGESPPAILTTIDVRDRLHRLISPEFPHVPLIAYQELSHDLSIQPVARISV